MAHVFGACSAFMAVDCLWEILSTADVAAADAVGTCMMVTWLPLEFAWCMMLLLTWMKGECGLLLHVLHDGRGGWAVLLWIA